MKSLPLLFVLPLALASLRAQEAPKTVAPNITDGFEERTFTTADGGGTIGYRLLKPEPYDPATKYPVVLFLHGAGERGSDNSAQLRNGVRAFGRAQVRAAYPCFVIAPQCPTDQKWADIDWRSETPKHPAEIAAPLKLALGTLDSVMAEFSIDADRVYLTGISMGGYGTWDAVTRLPGKWAAAVPICGGGDPGVAAKAKDIPIWAAHGVEDKAVKVERTREMISALEAAGGAPLYSEYPYVEHNSWETAYGEPYLAAWLFAQKRGQPRVEFAQVAGPFAQPPSNQFPGAGPVQSGLWFRNLWQTRRTQWSKDVEKDQGAVVFFGDSITQGWKTLAEDFPTLKVANRGISGDTTRGLRRRLKEDVLAVNPRAVSLLIGTNDLDQGAAPATVLANLQAIITQLHAAHPKLPIILNKVMPRGAKPGKYPEKIVALNAIYDSAFKNDPRITFCDTWTLFADPTGQPSKEEFPDLLHPNAAGYTKWKAALTPILEKLKLASSEK